MSETEASDTPDTSAPLVALEPASGSAPARAILNKPQPGHGQPPSQARDDAHLVKLWLYGKSEHTRDAYERDVRQFVDLIDRPLRQVTLEDIQTWDGYLEEHYARNTRRRKLATIKSLFSFGKTIGYFLYNVGTSVQTPNAKDDLAKRILTEEEVQRIFALEERLRNRVMLRVYYVSGCRVSELVDLTWSQVIPREGKEAGQLLVHGKGDKTRNVLLSKGTWEALMQLQEEAKREGHAGSGDAVFWSQKGGPLSRTQVWRAVKKASRRAGIDLDERPVSPHWLRHAHISHALDRGAPAHLVRDTVGHASLETTTKYAHSRPDESSGQYLGA